MAKAQRHEGRVPDGPTTRARYKRPGHHARISSLILAGAAGPTPGRKFNCCLVCVLVTCGVVFTMTDLDPDLEYYTMFVL